MKKRLLSAVVVCGCATLLAAGQQGAACGPVGNVEFICGQNGPEDLAVVPGNNWVLASAQQGMGPNGAINLINARTREVSELFPTASPRFRHDTTTYRSCPGPIDLRNREQLKTHGLYLKAGANALHTVYAVHHGSRESIEVFELNLDPTPSLTWIGCVVAPPPIGLNSVVALPEGGFAATNFAPRGADSTALYDPVAMTEIMGGAALSDLWEWHPAAGWQRIPDSESSGANGLELSPDGKWFYIGAWGSQSIVRLSRGETPAKKDAVNVGFRIDNVRWAPDGSLFAAGQDPADLSVSVVAKVDPTTLAFGEIVRYPANEAFASGTVAIQLNTELWLGSFGERIAVLPVPASPSRR